MDGLVERRERLGTEERRREQLVARRGSIPRRASSRTTLQSTTNRVISAWTLPQVGAMRRAIVVGTRQADLHDEPAA